MPSNPRLSIVMAAYNEAEYIVDGIKSVISQSADPVGFELIVVDNNSKDNSAELIKHAIAGHENCKYVLEIEQGSSAARNAGISAAQGEYVAFIDGDARLTSGWIERALSIISQHEPDIFGGPIYPFYTTPVPSWFKDEYEIRQHHDQTGWMPEGRYLSGSNMVFRYALLSELGGFNPRLGIHGDALGYTEETALLALAHRRQKRFYYDLELIVQHAVPEFKLHTLYFLSTEFDKGVSRFKMEQELQRDYPPYAGHHLELKEVYLRVQRAVGKLPELLKAYRMGSADKMPEQLEAEDFAPRIRSLGYAVARYQYLYQNRTWRDKLLDFNLRSLITKFNKPSEIQDK